MKLKILDQLGNEENLSPVNEIVVHLPSEDGMMQKRMSTKGVRILSKVRGEVELVLTKFEINGLRVGEHQNFTLELVSKSGVKKVVFEGALTVTEKDGIKEIGEFK